MTNPGWCGTCSIGERTFEVESIVVSLPEAVGALDSGRHGLNAVGMGLAGWVENAASAPEVHAACHAVVRALVLPAVRRRLAASSEQELASVEAPLAALGESEPRILLALMRLGHGLVQDRVDAATSLIVPLLQGELAAHGVAVLQAVVAGERNAGLRDAAAASLRRAGAPKLAPGARARPLADAIADARAAVLAEVQARIEPVRYRMIRPPDEPEDNLDYLYRERRLAQLRVARAVEVFTSALDPRHPQVAAAHLAVAEAYVICGPRFAVTHYRHAFDRLEQEPEGVTHKLRVHYALALQQDRHFELAERVSRDALASAGTPDELFAAHERLTHVYLEMGDLDRAEPACRAWLSDMSGPVNRPWHLESALLIWARVMEERGDHAEAERTQRRALRIYRRNNRGLHGVWIDRVLEYAACLRRGGRERDAGRVEVRAAELRAQLVHRR